MLQLSFEFTAMQTGIALMPFSIMLLIFAILGARLSSRYYAKRIIQVGFVIAAIGLGMIAIPLHRMRHQPNWHWVVCSAPVLG